jgi:hypothetical protein
MPYMKDGHRDYSREYAKYHSKPKQKKNRAARNGARAMMAKEGRVHKGDGKDVAHKKALSKGGLNKMYNLMVENKSSNRSFSKTKNSKMKSEVSKRERRK